MATALDTHEHYKRLRDAGFDERQAEALLALRVDQLGELVTKDYLRAELETFRNEIDARLREFEIRLRGVEDRVQGLEERMGGLEDRMRRPEDRFGEFERRFVRYLVAATMLVVAWGDSAAVHQAVWTTRPC